jgi:hypothetical protein
VADRQYGLVDQRDPDGGPSHHNQQAIDRRMVLLFCCQYPWRGDVVDQRDAHTRCESCKF